MLNDARERHRKWASQFGDGAGPGSKLAQDTSSARVGEGVKHEVQSGFLVKHLLKYGWTVVDCQGPRYRCLASGSSFAYMSNLWLNGEARLSTREQEDVLREVLLDSDQLDKSLRWHIYGTSAAVRQRPWAFSTGTRIGEFVRHRSPSSTSGVFASRGSWVRVPSSPPRKVPLIRHDDDRLGTPIRCRECSIHHLCTTSWRSVERGSRHRGIRSGETRAQREVHTPACQQKQGGRCGTMSGSSTSLLI